MIFSRYTCLLAALLLCAVSLRASSHREAPLIANDPLADNTDVYAFRSPDDPNTVTLIANYVPLQLPQGGPNYYQFGENVRYELHIDNDITTTGDDIIYRFTFTKTNEDPTTFFNIRLGFQNLKTTYTMERSMDGGASFQTIITHGVVPPNNIGPRSIDGPVGLNTDYATLMSNAITTTSDGEKVFCGPVDDPFFVDLGGIFDLGDAPRQGGTPKDGVSCLNVSTIAVQVPISMLQKDGKHVSMASDILDGDFVIGVWASASRPAMRTLTSSGVSYSGDWKQVSRLGMPLTNEAVIPIGAKDEWNSRTPYNENPAHFEYFYNPELALYMDDDLFGGAVPAFSPLRIQRNSLGAFDFGNGNDGLFGLKGNPALAGTALDDAIFGTLLLPAAGKPRSVDLWPAFHTGVPNLEPYQLATGKGGNPLATGKPFVNNFLPNGGDMLRLNMATPVTARHDAAFSPLGLIQAAVLGLTDPTYTATADLQAIPNMDGFPNGRRLEDDVTRIELQAVSGIVLAAIGLWYDDFDPTDPNASPVTQDLLDVLTYSTGVDANDAPFQSSFPYMAMPWSGAGACGGLPVIYNQPEILAPTQPQKPAMTIEFKNSENGPSFVTNKTIKPQFRIRNDGSTDIDLKDITMRYWFTQDNPGPLTVSCLSSDVGCGNTTNILYALDPAASGADAYLEVGFSAGTLSVGGGFMATKTRIGRGDNQNFNEAGDFSFAGLTPNFINNPNVTLYCKGVLIAGNEPAGFASTSSSAARQIQNNVLAPLLVKVHPNPFREGFAIEFPTTPEQPYELSLFNTMGQEVYKRSADSRNLTLKVGDLPKGIYFLQIRSAGQIANSRLLKE
ncbi:MAG: DUF4331 family protein [Bacteroidota bacterium]